MSKILNIAASLQLELVPDESYDWEEGLRRRLRGGPPMDEYLMKASVARQAQKERYYANNAHLLNTGRKNLDLMWGECVRTSEQYGWTAGEHVLWEE